ncbi:hypothetical protein ABBQ32_001038 [Trebouxia sp. C0010 RCD-2024]
MDSKGLYIVTGSKIQLPRCHTWLAPRPMSVPQNPKCSRGRAHIQAITTSRSGTYTKLREPDGSFGLPLLGESMAWLKDISIFFAERHEKHGMVFKSHVFGNKTVVISDPLQICRILQAEDKLAETAMPAGFTSLLPNSLFSVTKDEHRQARRMLTLAYAESSMRLYHPLVLEVVSSILSEAANTKEAVKGYKLCRTLAFDVAATVLLGVRWDPETQNKLRDEFTIFVQGAFSMLPFEFPGSRFKRAKEAQKHINGVVSGVIEDARQSMGDGSPAAQPGTKKRQRSVLQAMLEARDDDGNPLSEKVLQDQVIAQLFAGHETTAAIMTRMLQRVKANPDVLACMKQEQASLIEQHGPELTDSVVTQMPYIDAVIKECLRLHDPATVVFRRALQDIPVGDNVVIPKGWSIQLHLEQAQKNVTAFKDDASQFRPGRFLNDNKELKRKEPEGYAPWGAGARKCMGISLATAEMRLFLALLARDYDWECDAHEKWISSDNVRPENWLMTTFSKHNSGAAV